MGVPIDAMLVRRQPPGSWRSVTVGGRLPKGFSQVSVTRSVHGEPKNTWSRRTKISLRTLFIYLKSPLAGTLNSDHVNEFYYLVDGLKLF